MDVGTYLTKLSKNLEIDPILKGKIDKSIGFLQKEIWGLFQNKLHDVSVFGSYDRGTFIQNDPNSDVDILVIFKENEYQPETYLKQIQAFCKKTYPLTSIYPNHPTIVVDMEHIKFDIAPSYYYTRETLKIPAPRGGDAKWINSSPKKFKKALLERDAECDGMILPTVQLIKYWNFINQRAFDSYYLEDFIISHSYSFCSNLKDYFYEVISDFNHTSFDGEQGKLVKSLYERRRRLRVLEKENVQEFVEKELSSFLPVP